MPKKPPLGLARTLRDDIYRVTSGRPMKWVMVGELSLRHPHTSVESLDAALGLSIAKGWMLGEGTPLHSICLTDDGRRLSG